MLFITRDGGVGDRAGGLRRFATRVEAGGAGCGYEEYRMSGVLAQKTVCPNLRLRASASPGLLGRLLSGRRLLVHIRRPSLLHVLIRWLGVGLLIL